MKMKEMKVSEGQGMAQIKYANPWIQNPASNGSLSTSGNRSG